MFHNPKEEKQKKFLALKIPPTMKEEKEEAIKFLINKVKIINIDKDVRIQFFSHHDEVDFVLSRTKQGDGKSFFTFAYLHSFGRRKDEKLKFSHLIFLL